MAIHPKRKARSEAPARETNDQIRRRDHFFDSGGTSLSALKLAIALDRAVSFKDVAGHPVLADLAALVDARARLKADSPVDVQVRLTTFADSYGGPP